MKRSGPLKRGKPLARGGRLARRTPLRATRPGRARPDEPLALRCEFALPGVCTGRAQHRHHVLPRSAGGGDGDTADVCRPCHAHTHANPAESYATGRLTRAQA